MAKPGAAGSAKNTRLAWKFDSASSARSSKSSAADGGNTVTRFAPLSWKMKFSFSGPCLGSSFRALRCQL